MLSVYPQQTSRYQDGARSGAYLTEPRSLPETTDDDL